MDLLSSLTVPQPSREENQQGEEREGNLARRKCDACWDSNKGSHFIF